MSRLKTDAIRNVNASVDGITLDTSGNVAIPNELQLADKIVHTGDTNTFIRFPAADVIAFETGGTERLRINSDGRIWVNTQTGSSATELLRVENTGSSSTNSRVSIVSGGAAQAVLLFGDDQSFDQGQIVYSNSDHSMRFHANAGNERVRIDASGRVLIGTNHEGHSSADNLTVVDSATCGITIRSGNASTGNIYFSDTTSGTGEFAGAIEYAHNGDSLRLHANSNERLRITSDGKVVAGSTGNGYPSKLQSHGAGNLLDLNSTSGAAKILFYENGTGRFNLETLGGSAGLRFYDATNSVERLRIDSSGRLGLGVAPKSWHSNNKAVIQGLGGYAILARSNNFLGIYQNFYYDASDAGKYIETGEASAYFQNDGNHIFYTAASGSGDASASLSEVLKLQADKNVKVTDGDLVIGTSGHGIDFSATSDATGKTSELLDDYEEGTWTPTLNTGDFGVASYSTRYARYTKIGRAVHIVMYIMLSNKGSNSGNLKLWGLPFLSASSPAYNSLAVWSTSMEVPGARSVIAYVNPGSIYCAIQRYNDSSGDANWCTEAHLNNNSEIQLSGTYFV